MTEWDERYASSERIWSGDPNGALVTEVAGLAPGSALDVGCGEGADAVWLADRGWQVTGVDVSAVALDRARRHASDAGVSIAFVHAGLLGAPDGPFDLVCAMYPALDATDDHAAERALADRVAPGGTLLVVHHAPETWPEEFVGLYVQPADVAAALGDGWQVQVDETRERHVSGGSGAHHTHDVVLRARRGTDQAATGNSSAATSGVTASGAG